jgi:hypothetical protein
LQRIILLLLPTTHHIAVDCSREDFKMDRKDSPPSLEKAGRLDEKDETYQKRHSHTDEVARIDALAIAPGVTRESFAHLNEKKILRKMDKRLIPMLAALYLLSFLDSKFHTHQLRLAHRFWLSSSVLIIFSGGNIGNAKIEGLTDDLNISGPQYNWCLTVFFFSYAAFEVPSNLLLKKLKPSRWLPTIMV